MLGTAGTSKTHTAEATIATAKEILGRHSSIASVAHTGVAAANLGGGASTIDSLFKLGGKNEEDLDGEALDALVKTFEHVEFLLIDEISTVGGAQFEMISRRLEQVGKMLW